MVDSRFIPIELWIEARKSLIFFFSRRLGLQNAEDLAQHTLMVILSREDYEFAREEDFPKVCYGFAKKILREVYRDTKDRECVALDPEIEERVLGVQGLKGAEAAAFLEEVKRYGQEMLDTEEWALIEAVANRDEDDAPATGKIRTQVHRIRKRLAKITGWKKSEV